MSKGKMIVFAALLLFVLSLTANGQAPKERIYVWDFVDNDARHTDLTARFTSEFEEAIIQTKCFVVLERRIFDKLLAHIKNEKAIANLSEISKKSQDEVQQITNARTVVFGKVDNDVDSGEFKITVSFQHFDSSKEVWSARIPRGRILDAESRENAMKRLAAGICGGVTKSGGAKTASSETTPKPIVARYEERGVSIELTSCEMQGNIVACELVLENKSLGDRDLWLFTTDYYHVGSRMYDQDNNEYQSFITQLGNKDNGDRQYAKILAIPQQKIKALIKFKEVSRQLTSISLLRIRIGIAKPDQHIYGDLDQTFEAKLGGPIPIAK